MPVLVMSGGNSPVFMGVTARALAKATPRDEYRELAGQIHDVKAEAVAPALIEFFES